MFSLWMNQIHSTHCPDTYVTLGWQHDYSSASSYLCLMSFHSLPLLFVFQIDSAKVSNPERYDMLYEYDVTQISCVDGKPWSF